MKPTVFTLSHPALRRVFNPGIVVLTLIASLGAACNARSAGSQEEVASEEVNFQVVEVARGLENPWGIAFLPDGGILVTERPGRMQILRNGERTEVSGLPEVRATGQGGLMDVILHPHFEDNQWVYFSYSANYDGGIGTKVTRARLDDASLTDLEDIFRMNPPGSGGLHFGSRLAFDNDGYLFITIGERNDRHRAQELDSHHGTLLRVHDDGSAPEDNPFVGQENAHPEIYSYGHRNAQGMHYDAETGVLWLHEHGPRGGDALNYAQAGANYGWPRATYGEEYRGGTIGTTPDQLDDVVNPVLHWTPSIAASGLTLYRGDKFPEWEGNLFAGALAQQHIRRVVLDGKEVVHQEELIRNEFGRIRTVVTCPDGYLWFATDERNGGLYRIQPIGNEE